MHHDVSLSLLWHWYWAVRSSLHVGGTNDVGDAAIFAAILGEPYQSATLEAINTKRWGPVGPLMHEVADIIYPYGMHGVTGKPVWYDLD